MCSQDIVKVPEGIMENYQLETMSYRTQPLFGTMSFVAPDGQYLWYSIEVRTAGKSTVDTLNVSCPIHKAVAVEIPMTNPMDQELVLDAVYSKPTIVGPQRFTVGPLEETKLKFYYAPTECGESRARYVGACLCDMHVTMLLTGLGACPVACLGKHALLLDTQRQPVVGLIFANAR